MLLNYFTDKNISEVSLSANPNYYDYFHKIILNENGKVIMSDGGCQSVYGYVEGNFKIYIIRNNKIKIKFFNLTLHDPYDENIEFAKIDSMECVAHKKEVDFKFIPAYETNEYLYTKIAC